MVLFVIVLVLVLPIAVGAWMAFMLLKRRREEAQKAAQAAKEEEMRKQEEAALKPKLVMELRAAFQSSPDAYAKAYYNRKTSFDTTVLSEAVMGDEAFWGGKIGDVDESYTFDVYGFVTSTMISGFQMTIDNPVVDFFRHFMKNRSSEEHQINQYHFREFLDDALYLCSDKMSTDLCLNYFEAAKNTPIEMWTGTPSDFERFYAKFKRENYVPLYVEFRRRNGLQ